MAITNHTKDVAGKTQSHSAPGIPAKPFLHVPLLFGLLVLMIGISAVSLLVYDRIRYHPLVTVDVEKIMQQKMAQLQTPGAQIEQDEMIRLSRQWAQQLASEVSHLTTQYNAIVLVRPAVIEGAIDMTQQVMNNLEGATQ
jgi:hypothetical protein